MSSVKPGSSLSCAYVLSMSLLLSAQAQDTLAERALAEFRKKDYAAAERDLREIAKREPSNIYVQFYLGQTLFKQERYQDAATVFKRARELEKAGKALSLLQHRILTDQLAIAYGMSGEFKAARAVLDVAITEDPEYPLNYYNLACAFAEEGNKAGMLNSLALAFRYRRNVLAGEQMPDPRSDSSFRKYLGDSDFLRLMAELGFRGEEAVK